MVRGSVYPCRVASRKEDLLVQLGRCHAGVQEKGQTPHEKEQYFLHFTPEFDFSATSGGRSPDHCNGERRRVLGGSCSKH